MTAPPSSPPLAPSRVRPRYRAVVSKLQEASAAEGEVNSSKEAALEEISAMVREMNSVLKAKKAYLAPYIKKLRDVRKEAGEVEAEYQRKKGLYDKVSGARLQKDRGDKI